MTFNGWSNYQTWNVALYIQNEYDMYQLAVFNKCTYEELAPVIVDMFGPVTPDGVSYTDPTLDHIELDEMLSEIA
jgi:hypothetical protein